MLSNEKENPRREKGPVLLDTLTYRIEWPFAVMLPPTVPKRRSSLAGEDSIQWFGHELVKAGVCDNNALQSLGKEIEGMTEEILN
ncbi:MAG: thiamine pyrophosphate-dependent enzyme [Bacteroidales bacterium]